MLDVAPTELLLVAVVAVVVIGPKDLPRAMRLVGQWVGRARGIARQFRQGFDDMVREAEFKEMEKKWAEENARIMREFPSPDAPPVAAAMPAALPAPAHDDPLPVLTVTPDLTEPEPTVEQPAPTPSPVKRAARKPVAAKAPAKAAGKPARRKAVRTDAS